jgi:UDP-N-acetylglucosamine diphosphorylase/glucosamine-1-phosphate N-acetyltransferase
MSPPRLIIFDDGAGQWGPVADLRPPFDMRTGACTTRQRIEQVLRLKAAALCVADNGLVPLLAEQSDVPINASPRARALLCVNARWLGLREIDSVCALDLGQALVQTDGAVVAAHLDADAAGELLRHGRLPDEVELQRVADDVLITRPWHVLDHLATALHHDLATFDYPLLRDGQQRATCFGDYPVHVHPDATLQPGAVFNSEQGPIVVEPGALVGALAVIEGPCYVGADSHVTAHTHLRPNTSIGPMCKVGGEISCSIIHSYSNKGHHGYLGHAQVGQWVNLGAATNSSNLKNTYGAVRVQLEADEEREDTGRQFHGPIVGDFVRTSIGSRLSTGCVIGTGTMLASSGFAPPCVPRFSFLTDDGIAMHEMEAFFTTAWRMMDRRDCELSPSLEERLRDLADREASLFEVPG